MGSKGNGSGLECGRQGGPVGGPEGGVHEVLDIEKEYMNDEKGKKSDSDGSDSEDVDARVAYLKTIIDGSQGNEFFQLGKTYATKKELVDDISTYAIKFGVNVKLTRSEPCRVKAKCELACPFGIYASKDGHNPGLVVKTLHLEHRCGRVFKNPRALVKWLAGYFKRKVQERPTYKVADMKKDVESELKLHVSKYKCKRAKRLIMQEMEGSYKDEFNNLEAYCNELRRSNPGSDVCVQLSKEALENGKRVFNRMYLCFNAAKTGWKVCCRPLIGLDGTFLKGYARGIMLTATGIDVDESLYPIAIAVTQKENTLKWRLFLEWLKASLDLDDGA